MGEYHCRYCTQMKLLPTRPRWYEKLLLPFLLRPYRCKHCYHRHIRPII